MTNQGLALVPRAACSPRGEPGAHTKIRGGAGRRAPAVASGSVLQGSFSESGACLPSRVGGQGQQGRGPRAALPTFSQEMPVRTRCFTLRTGGERPGRARSPRTQVRSGGDPARNRVCWDAPAGAQPR